MTVIELLEAAGLPYEQKENDNVYTECHQCGSKNLSINVTNGLWHCWSASCGIKGNYNELATRLHIDSSFTATESSRGESSRTLSEGEKLAIEHAKLNKAQIIEWAVSRRLDPEFVMSQGIGYDETVRAMVFPFIDTSGSVIGAKYRATDGRTDQWIKGAEPLLYLLDPKDLKKDKVVIVEGEVDALTLKQFGIPVVAVLGAGKDKGFSLLRRTRQIYLGYDMDGAGEAGVEKAATALGRYRCKRVHWTSKDPNDMLRQPDSEGDTGRQRILTCLREAKSLITESKSKKASEALDDYFFNQSRINKRLSWGYARLDSFTKGIGGGMYLGILAEAGAGKTTFIVNAACNNASTGTNVGICSLEEHPTNEVAPKLAATLVGRNPETSPFTSEERAAIQPALDRIHLYEGEDDVDEVIEWIKELYYAHDVKQVFIDYFQLLVADEKNVQEVKATSYKFKKLTKDLPDLFVGMIFQPKQKMKQFYKGEVVENERLDGSDARGGAALNQSVDAMLTIKALRGQPNITQLEFTKVRGHLRVSKNDWLHKFTQLEYNHETLRQTEVEHLTYGG